MLMTNNKTNNIIATNSKANKTQTLNNIQQTKKFSHLKTLNKNHSKTINLNKTQQKNRGYHRFPKTALILVIKIKKIKHAIN